MPTILNPDRNCWRIEHAKRLSFLIDGAQYFAALREAMKHARYSIHVLCWDINSQLELVRDENPDGYPEKLGEFLDALVQEKQELNIYILNWDFAMIYAPDREWFPIYQFAWKTHARVHFCLDDYQPSGASQHQKIVIIDDMLAFVGGLDLTLGRWDTNDHLPHNPKRDRINNKISRPYHDVQIMLEGNVVTALVEMVRNRWQLASGEKLPPIRKKHSHNVWPESISADLENISVGLARTRCAYQEVSTVREIQNFYQDAISAAKHWIYIENQYFTAPSVGEAIKSSLEKEQGPEIVMVLPKNTDGWMSLLTMDVLRIRLIKQLQKYDKHKRLRVYYPEGPGLKNNPINVHSKLMVVDDTFATVGSANLNNRSMGLDTECNVIIDVQSEDNLKHRIAEFRNRLLSEHLGCSSEQVQKSLKETNSLIASIDSLTDTNGRFLNTLPLELSPDIDRLVPDINVTDPEEPLEPNLILKRILPDDQEKPTKSRFVMWFILVTVITGLAVMWKWTPLSEWITVDSISRILDGARDLPASPVWVVLGFIVAGFVAFPLTVLVIATVLAFGMLQGFLLSLIGSLLSSIIIYTIGEKVGRRTVRNLAGSKINKISKKLAQHGIITIIAVRIVPVAPFTVINLVAGASHINFRDYIVGTVLGMAPGIFAVTLIADRAYATIKNPGLGNLVWLILSVVIVSTITYLLVRWSISKTKYDKPSSDKNHEISET